MANAAHMKYTMLPLTLHENEKVLLTVKPVRSKYLIRKLLPFYIIFTAILAIFLFVRIKPTTYLALFLFLAVILAILFLLSNIKCRNLVFWITNMRLINQSGIVAYRIRSIPINVITDVVARRNFYDLLLNTYEVMLPTTNDDAYSLYTHTSGRNHIPSLDFDTSTKIQRTIFDLND